jgi:iron complex transport system ATP-binding protein
MISLKELAIGYKTTLFSIENILLKKGEVYALIGSNGAGKTTLLQSIIGVVSPLKGLVEINSRSISSFDRMEKAKTISFVGSKFDGVDFLRIREYINLGRSPYTNAFGRLVDKDHLIVSEAIKLLQIEYLEPKFTTELSDGERQLTAIARAIAQQTDIIILDEPTAFLDYANRKKVMVLMKKIATELNKCIIVSSHDLELCLESELELLVVNKELKKLELHHSNTITKEHLISIGF